MFTKLTNFAYDRTPLEALGFYLAYFGLIFIIGSVIGVFLHLSPGEVSLLDEMILGKAVAIGVSFPLAINILHKKHLDKNPPYLLLALTTGFAAAFGGAALGLLIPAYLSTIKHRKH